ncbi:3-oxoacyl-(acyl-carrier-protein) reductase [Brucella sp. NF 2653]|uniref:SDR family NAD(P)-dependent oxidoreductase n=1 Tax=unclassified Brucella TaxID=2632610 RepID=UPI0001B476A4|nr:MULTISPECIES: SDR family NAD(P)-dependent oxidoreductase [unclassified Brucella]EEZ34619.1 short-chain dehydrogenase/reductase SDR [Brucella sp. 83/13]EFM61844.1 3-oxoacyl-(acyl-carrier-protein) reductase [Brucella sp. NF 2653]
MKFEFENRTLVLTGANGGIGRAIAELFRASGANLVLTDLDREGLDAFAASLGSPERIATIKADASSADDAEKTVALAMERFGGIDFLVPSAGIYQAKPFAEMSDADWHRTISINLDGVFYLCKRALPALKEDSSIVTLASLAAYRGAYVNAHYSATKGAMVSMTRALSRELAPKTRVNGVAPGIIETPMTSELLKTRMDETMTQTPLKRLGKPSEIASVIAFLCSPAASFVTGETIQVNGGIYMA